MSPGRSLVAVVFAFCTLQPGLAQEKPPTPTWQEIMGLGIVPYRQLTVEDIPVNDSAHPKNTFYIRAAMQPRYQFILKPHTTGFVYAYIDQWMIFSGFDKKETSRKSTFKTMKAELPYAQALLDINEIHARQLAALKPGELPSGRGANFDEARADLEGKLKPFIEQRYQHGQAEMTAFAKATNNGADKKKVRELAAEIRKRLDATPAATVPFTAAPSALPGGSVPASPVPSAGGAPVGAGSGTPAPALQRR